MYLDFFKLRQLPFRLTADPHFYFENPERADAKRRLCAALSDPEPGEGGACLLVSGDAGIGKTTLVNEVLNGLRSRFVVVQIRQPELSVAELRAAIVAELDAVQADPAVAQDGASFDDFLVRQAASGRRVLIALDHGEAFEEALLDDVLLLPGRGSAANLELRVILSARTSVENALGKKRFAARSGRWGLQVRLTPLSGEATRGYIEHRLRIAGRAGPAIFRDDAYLEAQRFTGGVPRLINTLADGALIAAFNRSHDAVTAAEIRIAVNQLQWVEFDRRAHGGTEQAVVAEEAPIGNIRIKHAGMVVAEFTLPLGKLSLGRAANNDVRLDSRFVSRNHCQVVTTERYSVIEDLQSQNGLIVASRRVSVHRLQEGDGVEIGDLTLFYSRATGLKSSKPTSFPLTVTTEQSPPDTDKTGLIDSAAGTRNPVDPKNV
jgi:type II secretory pathway predicted ATPase ExeA